MSDTSPDTPHSSLAARWIKLDPDLKWLDEWPGGAAERAMLATHWPFIARPAQLPPEGRWHNWLILAGRGFGKTRAGAEWVKAIAEADPTARIALIAANLGEARRVMVEGESGILAVSTPPPPLWLPSLRRLEWANGARAEIFSAADPESLRGPQHSHGWCDELAKWETAGDAATRTWDNYQMGLRLGAHPHTLITTTPKNVPLLRRLLESPDLVITRGRTEENADNLSPDFAAKMRKLYGNSALARQELDGEMLGDVEGSLWPRTLLDACRLKSGAGPAPPALDTLTRVVVAVDPPAGSRGAACGIIAAACDAQGRAFVLSDGSVERPRPDQWASAAVALAEAYGADAIIAEANQGGDMVHEVLHASGATLPVKLVHASRGKTARAEPVAALYEAGRVFHCGVFAALEDELNGLQSGGGYQGQTRSPDRADALVWAITALLLGRRGEPKIRR